jgi:hypothetical protein
MIDAKLFKFILFEVVLVTGDGEKISKVLPVSYHPLFVGPRDISYTDQSRTDIQKTLKVINSNKAGRQPLRCTLAGSFGSSPRFTHGGFVDGFTRLKQFWNEVVRLGDTIAKEEVSELLSMLSINLPFWTKAGLPATFGEDSMWFEVNFYDFRNNRRFRCNIDQFQLDDSFTPNDLPKYSLQLTELGPVLTADAFLDKAIDTLFKADEFAGDVLGRISTLQLDQWNDMINGAVAAVRENITAIKNKIGDFFTVSSPRDMANLIAGRAADGPNRARFSYNVEPATSGSNSQILGTPRQSSPLQTINRQLDELRTMADEIYYALKGLGSAAINANNISAAIVELSETPIDAPVDYSDYIYATLRSQEDYDHLQAINKYYAMNADEYARRLANTLSPSRHSIPHQVKPDESIIEIAETYGVTPEAILDYNEIEPDDVFSLASINIPVTSSAFVPKIDNLAVFGSHQGLAALGTDISDRIEADSNGDLAVLSNAETIRQHISHIIAEYSDETLENIDAIPEYLQPAYLEIKLRGAIGQDPRIAAITNLTITPEADAFSLELSAETITRDKIVVKE